MEDELSQRLHRCLLVMTAGCPTSHPGKRESRIWRARSINCGPTSRHRLAKRRRPPGDCMATPLVAFQRHAKALFVADRIPQSSTHSTRRLINVQEASVELANHHAFFPSREIHPTKVGATQGSRCGSGPRNPSLGVNLIVFHNINKAFLV